VGGKLVGGKLVGGKLVGGILVGGKLVGGKLVGGILVGGILVGGILVGGILVGGILVGGKLVGGILVGGILVGGILVGGILFGGISLGAVLFGGLLLGGIIARPNTFLKGQNGFWDGHPWTVMIDFFGGLKRFSKAKSVYLTWNCLAALFVFGRGQALLGGFDLGEAAGVGSRSSCKLCLGCFWALCVLEALRCSWEAGWAVGGKTPAVCTDRS
jgi:hypothetical protein